MAANSSELKYRMIPYVPYRTGKEDYDSQTLVYVLKKGKYECEKSRRDAFIGRIQTWIKHCLEACNASVIMVVPGHLKGGASEVWDKILVGVLSPDVERAVLLRNTKVPKSTSTEGRRDKELHKSTIAVDNPEHVKDKTVLIVDDVYTTGASMSACYELVRDAGAAAVFTAAVGKTV